MALTDEQTDLLYQDQRVLEARRGFLRKLAEGLAASDQTMIEEAVTLKAEYEKIFAEQLKYVIENPPQPKTIPVTSYTGFARRA